MTYLRQILIRRWWVFAIAIPGVIALAVLASQATSSSKHLAESVVVVKAGARGSNPGNARNASDLAATYAESIPEDGGVIRAVATAVRQRPDDVAGTITTLGDPNTSIIRLRFEADAENTAISGADALVAAVTGGNPRARSVDPLVLQEIRSSRIIHSPSGTSMMPVFAGAIFGFLFAIVIIIGLERSDPRIDRVDQFSDEVHAGITDLESLNDADIRLLLDRWIELAGGRRERRPIRVGLIPAADSISASQIAKRIQRLASRAEYPISVDGEMTTAGNPMMESPSIDLATSQPIGTAGSTTGERLAHDADIVVLLVHTGMKVTQLRATVRVLQEYGTSAVSWGVLVNTRALRAVRQATQADGAPPSATGSDAASGERPSRASRPARPGKSGASGNGAASGAEESSAPASSTVT